VEKAIRVALLLAVLVLASYLRITGLTWGLTSGYGHYRNFQPDEFISLRGVLQIDLPAGRLKAPGAYFEGTFNYYLWALVQSALRLFKVPPDGTASSNAEGHPCLLYACRWMSVLLDLCTIIVVFLAIREATQDFYASLLGALCYAVLPMQVIYAHFMRTHILSNLLCALVVWVSLKLRIRPSWWMLLSAGILSGLGAATRYPAGIIVVIPCLYLLLNRADHSARWNAQFWQNAKRFVAGPVWFIAAGFVMGLFLGHPMLFLDSRAVIKGIADQVLTYGSLHEFKSTKLLNLSVFWTYISYLIPFAMYPFLWLLPYCAVLYLGLRRNLYAKSVPIMIFSLLYLYFIAKGYLGPYFARATMLLFPGLFILIGLAYGDFLLALRRRRWAASLLTIVMLLVIAPSVVLDVAYVRAMQRKDARVALCKDLRKLIGDSAGTIGVLRSGGYFYTAMPAVDHLNSKRVIIRLQDAGQPADFLVVGFGRPLGTAQLNGTIRQVEKQGIFKYERIYSVCPKFLGREFDLARFPQDMTYPFPALLLFRANART
jgi:Dolichyl-phosphate-mannose-protein mannosyltransferase